MSRPRDPDGPSAAGFAKEDGGARLKSILLPITPDPGHLRRVHAAISLIKRLGGGHLSCVQATAPPIAIGDPAAAIVVPGASDMMVQQAAALQQDTEAILRKTEVDWTWISLPGDVTGVAVSQSRLCDLILLNATGAQPSVAPVVTHARVPVLALPAKGIDMEASTSAIVAWNGSAASANALRASLPLLRRAKAVSILSVGKPEAGYGSERALRYLEHHAISAEIDLIESSQLPVSEAIMGRAEEVGAGLIVAGAFGHNRLREMLLGSVTRTLLNNTAVPLLLAH